MSTPRDQEFPTSIMRGENMNRVETFVAAAFAFAVTMLVISLDEIPQTFEELILACKHIPAFAASFAMVTWIWRSHANWSRWFGLEDTRAMLLSGMLVFLVLVYIYPLRIMMASLFSAISDDFFPAPMAFSSHWEVRFMFAFYAVGLFLLCLNFVGLYVHAITQGRSLQLSASERFEAYTHVYQWLIISVMCLLSLALTYNLPLFRLGYAGYCYFLLFPLLSLLGMVRSRQRKRLFTPIEED